MWALGWLLLQTVGAGSAAGAGAGSQDAAMAPVVDVALRRYGASAPAGGSAGTSGPEIASSYVWSDETLCTLGASSRELSFTPSVGWHVTARITQRTGDEFGVSVEWERIGSRVRQPAAPQTGGGRFTMRLGDHVELDRIDAATPGPCQTGSLRLEASIKSGSVSQRFGVPPGSVTSVNGAGGGGGRAGGLATGSRIGAGGQGGSRGGVGSVRPVEPIMTPPGQAVGPTVQSDDDLRLQMAALTELLKAQAARGNVDTGSTSAIEEMRRLLARPRFDAEVWLVHLLPNGREEVQRQATRFASRASIAFAPVSVSTAQGTVGVEVTAVLKMSPDPIARPLSVGISRRIHGAGSPPLDNSGGSDRLLTLPRPDEVVSFELPPLVGSMRDLLAGHAFSLRLRIAPEAAAKTVR